MKHNRHMPLGWSSLGINRSAGLICVGCCLLASTPSFGIHTCSSIAAGVTVDYLPVPPELPAQIQFTVNVSHVQPAGTPLPSFRLLVFNASGGQVASVGQTYSGTSTAIEIYQFDLCDEFIKSYRVDRFAGCTDGTSNNVTGSPTLVPEPDFTCPSPGTDLQVFMSDLECFTCDQQVGRISNADLEFYKSKRGGTHTLYTLPACGTSCGLDDSRYGEVVNGLMTAPAEGLLLVKVQGANDVVDMYASASPNAPGWQLPGQAPNERSGQKVDPDQCLALQGGAEYQFNIRTGRSDTPPANVTVTFDWYWWDSTKWCFRHDQEELDVSVQVMRLITLDDRPLAHRARFTWSGGEYTELRIPQCPTALDAGNLTEWFVMWPTVQGQAIPEGFAKRWTILNGTIKAPGADGEEYNFSQ